MNNDTLNLSPHDTSRLVKELRHPEDIVGDTFLSTAEKRALLAAWASDAHAVPDAPTLRQLDNGAVVTLASILTALRELDRASAKAGKLGANGRHDQILTKWRKRGPWRRRRRDDDDEPPPVPAALSVRALNPAWA